ncbi:UDP-glucose 6-dehydrogenase [Tritrichomonas foetus]|uniref:UDP-glucose 6-dehydrogenase n=1 Tax=Tritrichomonas foetus TaxID=1144522 RepID=A0A1J4L5N6_9EUKA|nr:UDP-glucose 6-dehydrogenase [Tritrichomonas foetus]|eukprot:OHT17262.1 UDP-glucose 6-dehydrogenase [Tritrichomonas foetus]
MTEGKYQIVCLGGGYVGGPSMTVLAEMCPECDITVIDNDVKRVEAWNSSNLPIHEEKLQGILEKVINKNLHFTTELEGPLSNADIIFIAVSTPTKLVGEGAGRAILIDHVESVARSIGQYAKKSAIVVEKSTVPIGVSRSIKTVLNANSEHNVEFQILSNPEFMAEGSAVDDCHNPDRILIGHEDSEEGRQAANVLRTLYSKWVDPSKIMLTDVWSAELTKLTVSAFLAQRISSMNAMSAICERTGANVNEVARACGADSRIGPKFLKASVGFGGSSLRKDVLSLVYIAESLGLHEVAKYWESVASMNSYQIERFAKDIVHTLFDTLLNKKLAIFGFAYKAQTDDTRDTPAIKVCDLLLEEGAVLNIFDTMVPREQIYHELNANNPKLVTEELFRKKVNIFNTDAYEATRDAHAIIILNDSPEFCSLDYKKIHAEMMKPAFIFDGRNLLNRDILRKIGFCTHGIGVTPDPLESE